MSFRRIEEMDEDDFLMDMRSNPKELIILKVGELRESGNDDGGEYFYMTFQNPQNFQTFDMGYNVRRNDEGDLYVGSKSKLYPILSYVSGINDGGIECEFSDIVGSLEGLRFKARTKREKYGNKKYFIIIPIDDGGADF